MPVDYSKWDRMDYGSDSSNDSDDNNSNNYMNRPRVTRLDQPSRLTRKPNGEILVEPPAKGNNHEQKEESTKETQLAVASKADPSDAGISNSVEEMPPAAWVHRGGTCSYEFQSSSSTALHAQKDVDNDHNNHSLYWTQDHTSVTLRFELPPSTAAPIRGKQHQYDCQVEHRLPFRDRHAAVIAATSITDSNGGDDQDDDTVNSNTSAPRLVATEKSSGCVLLSERLSYPVHAEADDDDDYLDWAFVPSPCNNTVRFLQVTLLKATPMAGITIWWRKPIHRAAHQIELDWVEENRNSTSKMSFSETWKEAHEQFRQQIKDKNRNALGESLATIPNTQGG